MRVPVLALPRLDLDVPDLSIVDRFVLDLSGVRFVVDGFVVDVLLEFDPRFPELAFVGDFHFLTRL